MKRWTTVMTAAVIGIAVLSGGCASPRQTATAGAWMGQQVGAPLGFAMTAIGEVFYYAGDVMDANPRWDSRRSRPCWRHQHGACHHYDYVRSRYHRTQILIETDSPTRILDVSLEDSEEATSFWNYR